MNEEVSRKAIFVLVVLALVISVLSTSLVLSAVYNVGGDAPSSAPSAGRVSLTVAEPPPSGKVVFSVAEQVGENE